MKKECLMTQLKIVEEALQVNITKGDFDRCLALETQRDNIEDQLEIVDPDFWRMR